MDSSVVERRTRDRSVAGSSPDRSCRRIFFSRVHFLCWLLFRYPFHPRVTAVAFCQRCRCQVTAEHTCTVVFVFEWSDTVNWCMVVWCTQNVRRDDSSFMWHEPCNNQIALKYTLQLLKNATGRCSKMLQADIQKCYSHRFRITCDKSAMSLLESRE